MHRLVLIMIATTVACGGDDTDPTTTNADTSTSATGDDDDDDDSSPTSLTTAESSSGATLDDSGDSSGGSSSDTSGTPTTDATESGSTDGSSGTGDSTTGQPSQLEVEISDATSFMNCQPIVPADPIGVMLTLDFDNQGDAVTSADVTSARLLTGGVEVVSFDLAPSSFGPFDAGETTSEGASKVAGSAMPANGCDTLDCGSEYDIEVEFDVDGDVAIATGAVTVDCVF